MEQQHRALQRVWYLRWIMLTLMVALAVALIVDGSITIGVLVAALAIARAVMFASWSRRRRDLGQRFPGRFGS